MPLVYMNSFLRGDNITWEIFNIFTQETQIITLYSYGSLATWLQDLNGSGALVNIAALLGQLLDFIFEIFEPIGDLLYTVMFDYGAMTINIPLWVGLAVTIPRMTLMFFAFKWFMSLFGVRI